MRATGTRNNVLYQGCPGWRSIRFPQLDAMHAIISGEKGQVAHDHGRGWKRGCGARRIAQDSYRTCRRAVTGPKLQGRTSIRDSEEELAAHVGQGVIEIRDSGRPRDDILR